MHFKPTYLTSFNHLLFFFPELTQSHNMYYSIICNRVDTHLNVFQMELTTRYNNIKNTMAGLDIMRSNWAGNKWSNSQVNLHHALLGKSLGGGVAYVGVVCNKNYGMGVSTSISGSFSSMGAGVVWDSMVFTHEIG